MSNLSRKKLQQLVAAARSQAADDSSQIEAAEHEWHKPNCFSTSQLKKLDGYARKLARGISAEFGEFYHSDFDVTVTGISQHFAEEYRKKAAADEQDFYYLGFSDEKSGWQGLVGITGPTAVEWASKLLGGASAADASAVKLSQLEESLLCDVVALIVKMLSDSEEAFNLTSGDFVHGRLPIDLGENQELCRLSFDFKESGSEKTTQAYILVPCAMLQTVAGHEGRKRSFSAEQISEAMFDHIYDVPIDVTAKLASTVLTFEELMNLQAGDIVLLDRKVDEAIEVLAGDKLALYGRPAKSGGKYAVVITEVYNEN
jgi:flagellar motor switch protein FliM